MPSSHFPASGDDRERRLLRAVAENATLALFIMDERQRCTYMNAAAERLTGFALAEVQGKPLHDYVHHTRPDGRPYPLDECPIDRAFPQNEREQGTEVFVHRDGSFYPVAFTASPIRDERTGQPVGTIVEVRDIRDELTARADGEFLLALGTVLQSGRDHDALVAEFQRRVTEYLGATRCTVTETDAAQRVSHVRNDFVREATNAAAAAPLPAGFTLEDRPPDLVAEQAAGRTVIVEDTATDPRTASRYAVRYAPLALRALIAVPLVRQGRFVASLAVTQDAPRVWTRREAALVQAAAERLWPALEATRALAAERDAREHTERLQRVTSALGEALTPPDVARVIVEHGVAALGAEAGSIVVLRADGSALDLVSAVGYPEDLRDTWPSIPMDAALPASDAVRLRAPVVIASEEEWRARYPGTRPYRVLPDSQAWAAVPLMVGDRVLGVMGLSFRASNALGAADRALMTALAQQCAQAWERARLYVDERRAREEAEAASRAKTQFLATMSHELRTPLNAIAGHVQLVEMGVHGPLTTAQGDALARVQKAQRHLLALIDEVLSFSKLASGAAQFDVRPVRLADVVAGVGPLIQPQLAAKELGYRGEVHDETLVVLADREKLVQLLLNLLSNAAKFTPSVRDDGRRGEVIVDVAERAGTPGLVYLRVRDNGVGVATAEQDVIFEPFVQAGRSLNRPVEGVGLGLAISRDLARGMGGDLRVRSVEGEGATFTVTLRLANQSDHLT